MGCLPSGGDGHRVADAGDALLLHNGSGGVEGSGAAEEEVLPFVVGHSPEKIPGQHHGAAPAPGPPGVDILGLRIKQKTAAVLIDLGHVNAVSAEEIGLPVTQSGMALPCGSSAIWSKE